MASGYDIFFESKMFEQQQPNVIDSMIKSVEEWYNAVDEAVKKSTVIPEGFSTYILILHAIDSK